MNFFAYFLEQPHPFLWHFWGPWGIRFYSLAYLGGFYVLFVGMRWQARVGWSQLRGDAIADYVTWVALAGVILGGRLGYCLLYAPRDTFTDPLYFFTIWKGGMASHGGVLGVILVMIFFARAAKIPFYNLADATAFCVPVTLGLGRCANFLNGELWGRPTTAWWGVVFPEAPLVHGVNVPRYPSQLIEALLEGVVLQLILLAVRLSTRREGAVALTFMAGYAILRIVGEQFREPDEGIGYWFNVVTQGQLLSAIMLLITALLAWRQFISRPSAGSDLNTGEATSGKKS
ncbi:MAG TPA: prolipoprotein diacylglyceryl transferase [Candidatus Methylacidiphilales bacterium]|nr:prolipoprotein diacylglyceryl transferase [Candidatus Methylacidiphilales bacterium]